MVKKRLAFKYVMRRFFLLALILAIVAVPIWFFASKTLTLNPDEELAPDDAAATQENAAPAALRFDSESGDEAGSEPEPEPEPDPEPEQEIDSEPDVIPPSEEKDPWALILINSTNFLPEDYEQSIELATITGDYAVDARIADNVKRMLADAKGGGIELTICSAYRSIEKQQTLFADKTEEFMNSGKDNAAAQVSAATIVARPGTSEHHTGLALDIVTPSYTILDEGFENTPAFKWLDKNAHKYGFVLRFPKGKQDITGIIYEPWHYRYVGEENAVRMKEQSLCLEEYVEALRNARIKAAAEAAGKEAESAESSASSSE